MSKYSLKITSAVTLDGAVVVPGKVVEVEEKTAKNLLERGKAELAPEKPAAPKKTASRKSTSKAAEPVADEPKDDDKAEG